MRNLTLFLIRYHAFFLFLFLEVIAFTLLINNNTYHNAYFINSANFLSGNFNNSMSIIGDYFRLKKMNTDLAEENALLRSRLGGGRGRVPQTFITSVKTSDGQVHHYVSAKVINNSTHKVNNFLTLNKGIHHGVSRNQGVVCEDGIVGITRDVSNNFSTVMSALNLNSRISAKVKKNQYLGSIYWEGRDPHIVILADIPSHTQLEKGDTIVTSGFSSFFPENIPIGIIEKIDMVGSTSFYRISVRLTTNFENLRYVFVVNDLSRDEKIKLEQTNSKDE